QQPAADHNELTSFLNTAVPGEAPGLLAGLSTCVKDYNIDMQGNPKPYPEQAYEQCLIGLDTLDDFIAVHRQELIAATSARTENLAEVAALSFRSWQGETYYYETDAVSSY